jgi:hypothetical protein
VARNKYITMNLKNFKEFKAINEGISVDNMISSDQYKSIEELEKKVSAAILPAYIKFAKEHNLNTPNPHFHIYPKYGDYFIRFSCDSFKGGDFGIISDQVTEAQFSFFGGFQIHFDNSDGFKFYQYPSTTLYLELKTLRNNASMQYCIERNHPSPMVNEHTEIFYDLLENKFLTYSERFAKELNIHASKKLAKTNKQTGIFDT